MRNHAEILFLLAFVGATSIALAEDLALPVGYVSIVTCDPDSEIDGPCTFSLQPGGEAYVSLDALDADSARVTGLAEGDAVLEVSADRLLGPGELILTETHLIEVYPFTTSLGVSFGQPAAPE